MSDSVRLKVFSDTTIARETLFKLSLPRLVSELVLLISQTLRLLQLMQRSAQEQTKQLQKWSLKSQRRPLHPEQAQQRLHQLLKMKLRRLKKGKVKEMEILVGRTTQYSDKQSKKGDIGEVVSITAVAVAHNTRSSRIKPVRSATIV